MLRPALHRGLVVGVWRVVIVLRVDKRVAIVSVVTVHRGSRVLVLLQPGSWWFGGLEIEALQSVLHRTFGLRVGTGAVESRRRYHGGHVSRGRRGDGERSCKWTCERVTWTLCGMVGDEHSGERMPVEEMRAGLV